MDAGLYSSRSMFTITCPACNRTLNLPDAVAGKIIRCLKCKSIIMVSPHRAKTADYSKEAQTTDIDDELQHKKADRELERAD